MIRLARAGEAMGLLEKERREQLSILLTTGEGNAPQQWEEFWQKLLAKRGGSGEEPLEFFRELFLEGQTFLHSHGLSDAASLDCWLEQLLSCAQRQGVQREKLLRQIITSQAAKMPSPQPTRTSAPQTRGKILRAALEVFAAKGFHGATVDDIAEKAGLGKGTVYRHFSSKRELFSELIRSKVAELEAAVENCIDADADVLEIIEKYLHVYFAFFDRNRNLYKVLVQEQSDFGAEVRALYIGNILRKVPLLKRKIYQAASEGRLKQLNFRTVFYGVMGFIDGVMQKWLASDGSYSLVDEVPAVLETVFYGFVNEEPRHRGRRRGRAVGAEQQPPSVGAVIVGEKGGMGIERN